MAQDEREGKRLRRKQSNRESARRSRLRKQAESESLNGRVETLLAENSQLREENGQLRERLDALQPELVCCAGCELDRGLVADAHAAICCPQCVVHVSMRAVHLWRLPCSRAGPS